MADGNSADYAGEVPKDVKDGGDYFVARSPSYVNLLVLRGFLVDGKPDAASKKFREGVKVYPLAREDDPPRMEFFNGSRVAYNSVHANNFEFYKELDHVFQKEPLALFDPELRGLAAAIGLRKGRAFAPDERMTKLLTDAIAVANATARSIGFRNRDPRSEIYEGSHWRTGFVGSDYRWLDLDGVSGRGQDAHQLLLFGDGQHSGDGGQDSRQRLAIRDDLFGSGRKPRSTAPKPTSSMCPPTLLPRISGRWWSMTRRLGPSCRPDSPSQARTAGATA